MLQKLLDKILGVKPLPWYPEIALRDVPAASVLLFYGGTKLTELAGNYLYRHKYKPAAFHAAFYAGDGRVVNVGKTTQDVEFETLMRSTRRTDVLIYKDLGALQRSKAVKLAMQDVGQNTYDWKGFLSFGLRFVKPSKKDDFCSDHCVDVMEAVGYKISAKDSEKTAPWHLLEWALAHPGQVEVRTLWVGPNFRP